VCVGVVAEKMGGDVRIGVNGAMVVGGIDAPGPWASGRWQLATHVGNMRTGSTSLVRSLPIRQSVGPHFTHAP